MRDWTGRPVSFPTGDILVAEAPPLESLEDLRDKRTCINHDIRDAGELANWNWYRDGQLAWLRCDERLARASITRKLLRLEDDVD